MKEFNLEKQLTLRNRRLQNITASYDRDGYIRIITGHVECINKLTMTDELWEYQIKVVPESHLKYSHRKFVIEKRWYLLSSYSIGSKIS